MASAHLVLNVEDVLHLTVEAPRPAHVAVRYLDELRRDAQPSADELDGSLHDVAHPQLSAHILEVVRPAPEAERRAPSGYAQTFDPR